MKFVYREGKFIDFKGLERPFNVCVCLQKEGFTNEVMDLTLVEQKDKYGDYLESECPSSGVISVGLSICHESDLDVYDPAYGVCRSEGRAIKVKNCALVMPVSNIAMITADMMESIADNIVKDVERCPGKYIKGYNQMEINYLKKSSK